MLISANPPTTWIHVRQQKKSKYQQALHYANYQKDSGITVSQIKSPFLPINYRAATGILEMISTFPYSWCSNKELIGWYLTKHYDLYFIVRRSRGNVSYYLCLFCVDSILLSKWLKAQERHTHRRTSPQPIPSRWRNRQVSARYHNRPWQPWRPREAGLCCRHEWKQWQCAF